MKSCNEKIMQAHSLACALATRIERDAEFDLSLDDVTTEVIWGHAEGTIAKWLCDRRDGRCSLQASIDFDPTAEEERLDAQIVVMQELR